MRMGCVLQKVRYMKAASTLGGKTYLILYFAPRFLSEAQPSPPAILQHKSGRDHDAIYQEAGVR